MFSPMMRRNYKKKKSNAVAMHAAKRFDGFVLLI